jgi:hypothetical protein
LNRTTTEETLMYYGIGLGVLYLAILVTLGVTTLRKGHGWIFVIGIFIPVFWLVGALMRPAPGRGA